MALCAPVQQPSNGANTKRILQSVDRKATIVRGSRLTVDCKATVVRGRSISDMLNGSHSLLPVSGYSTDFGKSVVAVVQ